MPQYEDHQIKSDVILKDADLAFAWKRGNEITKKFIELLPGEWRDGRDVSIDTKIHQLNVGWYTSPMGWCRSAITVNEPHQEYIIALINSNICDIEFATGRTHFSDCSANWDKEVKQHIKDKVLHDWVTDGHLTKYNDHTWTRSMPAKDNGWRWYGRATRYIQPRRNQPLNEVQKQGQIFICA